MLEQLCGVWEWLRWRGLRLQHHSLVSLFFPAFSWILFDQATYTHTVLSSVVVVDRFPPAIPHHLHLCYKFQLVSPFVHTLLCDMTVPILCWKSLMDFCRLVCIKSISNGSLHTDACSMWSCHINTMAVTSQLTIQGKDYNKLTEVCLYFYLPMKSTMLPTRQRRKQNECPLLSASPMCLAYMTCDFFLSLTGLKCEKVARSNEG